MPWTRFADDFPDHPKVVAAGPLAAWMFVAGLCYANRYATDGFIPSSQVSRLTAVEQPKKQARKLVEVHLWEVAEGGFLIHDFADYQPSSAEVKRDRDAAAKRQAEYRARRADARNAARNGVTHASVTRESRSTRGTGAPGARATGAPAPGPARPGVNTGLVCSDAPVARTRANARSAKKPVRPDDDLTDEEIAAWHARH